MPKGRRKLEVDRACLQKAIKMVEREQEFTTLGSMHEAAAEQYNKLPGVPEKIKTSVVGLRIKEFGLECKTKPGKRGQHMIGKRPAGSRTRTSKADKFKSDPAIQRAFEEMRKGVPERFLPVIEKVEAGSRTAAVQLKCLDCCCWQTAEVRKCECFGCSLWAFRPYQGSNEVEAEEQEAEGLEEAA